MTETKRRIQRNSDNPVGQQIFKSGIYPYGLSRKFVVDGIPVVAPRISQTQLIILTHQENLSNAALQIRKDQRAKSRWREYFRLDYGP